MPGRKDSPNSRSPPDKTDTMSLNETVRVSLPFSPGRTGGTKEQLTTSPEERIRRFMRNFNSNDQNRGVQVIPKFKLKLQDGEEVVERASPRLKTKRLIKKKKKNGDNRKRPTINKKDLPIFDYFDNEIMRAFDNS